MPKIIISANDETEYTIMPFVTLNMVVGRVVDAPSELIQRIGRVELEYALVQEELRELWQGARG